MRIAAERLLDDPVLIVCEELVVQQLAQLAIDKSSRATCAIALSQFPGAVCRMDPKVG